MQITQHAPQRLVIAHKRPLFAGVMGLFTALSVFMLVSLVAQGIPFMPTFKVMQWVLFVVWGGIAVGLIAFGVFTVNLVGRGMTCIFDKSAQTVTLTYPKGLRSMTVTYPIFAVSHLEIEHNQEVKAFAVFLVLRSRERLSMGTVTPFDEVQVRAIAKTTRDFLQHI